MKNEEIAAIFYKIADVLELKKVKWKPAAYRKAARSLESLAKDVSEIYKEGGIKALDEIPGIGEALSEKIVEYLKSGKIKEWEKLKKVLPKGFYEMLDIPGVGVKKARIFYKKLGIKTLKDLEKAIKEHKIRRLEGFREKTEKNLLEGIEFVKKIRKNKRLLLGTALPIAENLKEEVEKIEGVEVVEIAGSLRRMKETIGDIDLLVVGDNKAMDRICKLKNVKRVVAKGTTRATVILDRNLQADIRLMKRESYGAALQYFTGNKSHSIHLRKIAIKKNMKLNEYGLFKRSGKMIAGENEEGIYQKLGMQYIPPEMRHDSGEIEDAMKKKLPKIVEYKEVKGDLHMHTNYSDGNDSLKTMVEECEKRGYKFMAITDHAGEHLPVAGSMDSKTIKKQIKEIERLNKKTKIRIFSGAEVDILKDGSLSVPNDVLKKLDVVVASVHSGFKFSEEKMTKRILKALDNPYVNVLGHPTGRLIFKRDPYKVDLKKVFEKASERGVALEVNSFPSRLDLSDDLVREALDYKVRFSIGTDSHSREHLWFLRLGIAQARRGWATKKDVINTFNEKKLERFLAH